MKSLVGLLAMAGALAGPVAAQDGMTPYVVTDGRIVLSLVEANIEGVGLSLTGVEESAALLSPIHLEGMAEPMLAFSLTEDSDLRALKFDDGAFVPYGMIDGAARVIGGFSLTDNASGRTINFQDFSLEPRPTFSDGPGELPDPNYFHVVSADGKDEFVCYCVKIHLGLPLSSYWETSQGDHEANQLVVKAWDLVLTGELARRLGRPELADSTIAEGKLEASLSQSFEPWHLPRGQNITTPYAGAYPPLPNTGSNGDGGIGKDVALGLLGGMSQFAHFGSFPTTGRVGFAMSTTSCNFGNENVPWLAPGNGTLQEDHPGITQAVYRLMPDPTGEFTRFEQVAAAWIKHGFFALSSSQCTPCQQPSNGTFLGVGCSDTYGASNNASQFYLGPYSEWNGFLNTWDCTASFFDGPDSDCQRDVFGAGNAMEHRMEALDSDLDDAGQGATYSYGSLYLVRGDTNLENNLGTRVCTFNWNGSSWQFTVSGSSTPVWGPPAENRWTSADMHTRAGPGKIGNVVLSVEVTQLVSGDYRYEYALFNWNLDRRVNTFTVPVCGAITDIYFRDWDQFPSALSAFDNDWDATVGDGNISWEWNGAVANHYRECGPLEFNSMYNFGFTSTVGPADRDASLKVHDAGSGGDRFLAGTRAPSCINLTANTAAPKVGETLAVTLSAASEAFGGFAITEIGGVTLASPFIIALYVPLTAGSVTLNLPVLAAAAGVDFKMLAADHDSAGFVGALTNTLGIAVQ